MPRLKYHELAPGRDIRAYGQWMHIEEVDRSQQVLFAVDQDGQEHEVRFRDVEELYPEL
jgi:hypothetical protein